MSTALADPVEGPIETCATGVSGDEFYRDVAFHLGQAHDNYLESKQRIEEEGGRHNGKSYFIDAHKYVRPADTQPLGELHKIRKAYFEEHATSRGEILRESKHELQELGLGATLTAGGLGAIAGELLGYTHGTMEAGFGFTMLGALDLLSGGSRMHAEHGPENVVEGLKYVWENKSLPPSEKDVARWEGVEQNIDIIPGEEIDRYLGDLPELYGEDLDGVDLDDLGTLHNDEMPDGCEIGVIIYYNELPDYDRQERVVDPSAGQDKGFVERVKDWLI